MIAKNLRDAGINAEAKAIDFNTLVARMQTMDFQMLIIGWSLSSEPVGNVFDILGPKSTSNTFGFWAADDPNPFYKDLGGVNTLADAPTQALAREVDRLAGLARGTFNVSDQIKYTLWGEGAIAQAIPVNVLYYRVNIEAYSKAWSGWTPYLGSLWSSGANIFNLASLQKTGTAVPSTIGSVNLALTMPGVVGVGKSVNGFVKALDQLGTPLAGAVVNVTVAGVAGATTVQVTPASGTTDANGVLSISATGTANGYSYVNATARKGGVSATRSVTMRAVTQYESTLYVTVKPGKLVLRAGETTPVNLKVTDEKGLPVAGVNLTADKNLVSYGSLSSLYLLTDANGLASTTFNAPVAIDQINAHEPTTLFYTATKAGYSYSTGTAVNMLIYNPAAPNWVMAKVESVSRTDLAAGHNISTIKIQAVSNTGATLPNHKMTVSYSNSSILVSPVTTILTDGTGNATFNVQIAVGTLTQGLRVTVRNATTLQSVPATITLTYVGSSPPAAPMYGGYMTLDTYPVATRSMYMAPLESIKVTARMFDDNGALPNGINASLVLSATAYGSLAGSDLINWDSTFDGLGINIVTSADKANVITSGPLNTFYNYTNWVDWFNNWVYFDWGAMTGIDINNGLLTFWVNGSDVAPLDLIGSIYLVPEGMGFFNDTTLGYEIDGQSLISSQYVIGRSYEVVAPTYVIAKPAMVAKLVAPFDNTTVNVTVTDKDNNVAAGVTVEVYENSVRGNTDYTVTAPAGPTDALGKAQATIKASKKPSANVKAEVFVKASMPGALAIFQQTQVFIYVTRTFVSITPITDAVAIGSQSVSISATVVDWSGAPIRNMSVELTTDVGAVLGNSTALADATGTTKYNVSTPWLRNTRVSYMTLQAKAGGKAYDISLGYLVLTLQNAGPQIAATIQASKGSGENVFDSGVNVTLSGKVFDPLGLSATNFKLDTGSVQIVTGVTSGLGNATRNLDADLGAALTTGTHTVRINATDAMGISNELVLTFEVKDHKAASTLLPWAVAVIGWVLFAIMLVMMMMARRPKATPEMGMGAGAPEAEKPEEAPKM
jgi:hypothetical protein